MVLTRIPFGLPLPHLSSTIIIFWFLKWIIYLITKCVFDIVVQPAFKMFFTWKNIKLMLFKCFQWSWYAVIKNKKRQMEKNYFKAFSIVKHHAPHSQTHTTYKPIFYYLILFKYFSKISFNSLCRKSIFTTHFNHFFTSF